MTGLLPAAPPRALSAPLPPPADAHILPAHHALLPAGLPGEEHLVKMCENIGDTNKTKNIVIEMKIIASLDKCLQLLCMNEFRC